ncbi:MAG TPA: hypothetical protein VGG92_00895 [Caulobacteraceae bacterium]|jgi:hypothetical protein
MAGFSIQDAAFGGFAAVRAHPLALLVWTPLAFVISLASQVVFIQAGGQEIDFSMLSQDPARLVAMAEKVLPSEAAVLAVALVANAFVQPAMIRLVFSSEDGRFGYFRIGAHELRQLGLELLATVVLMGGYFGCAVGVSIVVTAVSGLGNPAMMTALTAGVAATFAGLVVVMVRLSLAPALTFDSGKLDLFGSWRLTVGRFWPLLGTYILTFALAAAVLAFANLLFFGLAGLVLGREMAVLADMPRNIADCFTPLRLIAALFSAFVTALIWPVILTPSARIYRSLRPAARPRFVGPGPQPWA